MQTMHLSFVSHRLRHVHSTDENCLQHLDPRTPNIATSMDASGRQPNMFIGETSCKHRNDSLCNGLEAACSKWWLHGQLNIAFDVLLCLMPHKRASETRRAANKLQRCMSKSRVQNVVIRCRRFFTGVSNCEVLSVTGV